MLDDHPVPGDGASAMPHVSLDATPPNLSTEDLEDIAAGDIPLGTVQAFEQAAVAREAQDLREAFEERAAILEYDAGLPRAEAELEAARIAAAYARNRSYLWSSLRPVSGSIVITEADIEAARKGRTVVRQGTFAGAHEVAEARGSDA
jgi:hypothetical protein